MQPTGLTSDDIDAIKAVIANGEESDQWKCCCLALGCADFSVRR